MLCLYVYNFMYIYVHIIMYLHRPKSGLGEFLLAEMVDMLNVYMNVLVYTVCACNCSHIMYNVRM